MSEGSFFNVGIKNFIKFNKNQKKQGKKRL